ncbi:MAG: Methyltransferase type 11 [Gemmataceae bacterium]|nr:Methyltransferase type 11 [Gemmataceae bacterium]
MRCHICRAGYLRRSPDFARIARVTSDAKPFPAGGELAVCEACGTIQKPITPSWEKDAAAVYEAYTIYHNAGGTEQAVFAGGGGHPTSRSSRLVGAVRDRVGLPAAGRMLDLGCGNGAMLRSFGEQMPGWALVGNDLSDKYRTTVEAIPGVEGFYPVDPENVPGTFDVITLLHVLEHIPDPVSFLRRLGPKLGPGGLIVVEVPDARHNPFDLAVADHCSHFTPETLRAVFGAAGFEVVVAGDDFVPKELTVVGRAGGVETPLGSGRIDLAVAESTVRRHLAWLAELGRVGLALAETQRVGVFGTSLGGAWLLGELGPAVGFFVDEDPAKVGKVWDGRPIIHPAAVPAGATVLIGLPPVTAVPVKTRLEAGGAAVGYLTPAA